MGLQYWGVRIQHGREEWQQAADTATEWEGPDMTLSHMRRGEGKEERGEPSASAGGPKESGVTKLAGFYREATQPLGLESSG